jgi:hypothetical protein
MVQTFPEMTEQTKFSREEKYQIPKGIASTSFDAGFIWWV